MVRRRYFLNRRGVDSDAGFWIIFNPSAWAKRETGIVNLASEFRESGLRAHLMAAGPRELSMRFQRHAGDERALWLPSPIR